MKKRAGRFLRDFRKGVKDIFGMLPGRADIKASFGTVSFRHGTYSAAAVALVIIIAVVLNMIVSGLPESVTAADISSNRIYEISDTSSKLIKGLDKDVKITVIAEDDSIDDMLRTFLEKYTAQSEHLSLEYIDPVLHPSALEEYDTEKDTIVVACEKTGLSKTVKISDILVQDSYSYYYTGSSSVTSFDGDGQITSAVSKVIGQETSKVYYVSGHGESELPSSITELMTKSGIEAEKLELFVKGSIPSDCDLLIFNGPTSDISSGERKVIDKYIRSGGSVIMLMAEDTPANGNLARLMKSYKITLKSGYVADMQRSYQSSYYMIIPEITDSSGLTGSLSSGTVLMNNSRAFGLGESSDDITVNAIMETSENGYLVSGSSQKKGSFAVGAAASYTAEKSDDSSDGDVASGNLIVFGSMTLIDDSITASFANLDNRTLFMNTVSSSVGSDGNTAVEAKSLQVQYNTVRHGGLISVMLIFIIPAAFLVFGFMIWRRRRKV